jgi:hypothetical protein
VCRRGCVRATCVRGRVCMSGGGTRINCGGGGGMGSTCLLLSCTASYCRPSYLIKYTQQYGEDVHRAWAEAGLAPELFEIIPVSADSTAAHAMHVCGVCVCIVHNATKTTTKTIATIAKVVHPSRALSAPHHPNWSLVILDLTWTWKTCCVAQCIRPPYSLLASP